MGDTNPVVTVLNPGQFIVDPVTSNKTAFDGSAKYIKDGLFGNLANQREQFLADTSVAPKIRVISVSLVQPSHYL